MKWHLSMGGNLELFHLEVFIIEFDKLQLPVQPIWRITLFSEEDSVYGFLMFFGLNQGGWTINLVCSLTPPPPPFPSISLPSYNLHPLLGCIWQSISFIILRNETLTHVTVHQGNGKWRWHRVEKFSLSLKRTWNNIIPSYPTQLVWLYLSFLVLIWHLFLGLCCCKMGDFVSPQKLLIVLLLLRRFEKRSNAFEKTNVWTVPGNTALSNLSTRSCASQ